MVREIKKGDPQVWITVLDKKTGQTWNVNPDWLKQHLGFCALERQLGGHNRRLDMLIERIFELEKTLINHKMPLARNYLADLFHRKGEINTRQLNIFIAQSGSRLDRKTVQTAFNQMVADGTLQFKSQGKGHPRLWFLKEE